MEHLRQGDIEDSFQYPPEGLIVVRRSLSEVVKDALEPIMKKADQDRAIRKG